VRQQLRTRVLRWFARAHLDPADAREMAGWDYAGGLSLDASVRIDAADRPGWSVRCATARVRRLR
jgi:hypothetical protein